ncbi:MAG: diadenylate cyclase CdaA [Desulfuromonadia bacterium]
MPPQFRIQDIFDILIITALVYQLYRWFRNTRAVQVLIGLSLIALLYLVTRAVGLFMTSWILQQLGTVIFVLIIVVFQQEIRQTLYRISLLRHAFGAPPAVEVHNHADLVRALFSCAATRTGALVVIRREDRLDEYLSNGVSIGGEISRELIESIFYPGSPLHDGAVLIEGDRVVSASCHLPLAQQSELPAGCGTRHRAALGITERTDAVAIVVSEERGTLSVAVGETLTPVATEAELSAILEQLLTPRSREPQGRRGVMELLFDDIRTKVAILALVLLCWVVLTIRQGEIVTVTAPIRYRNIPQGLVLTESSPDELELQLKVYSYLIPSPGKLEITADIDLAKKRAGKSTIPLSAENFTLPLGVVFSQVKPSIAEVTLEQKEIRRLPVVPSIRGGLEGRKIAVEPRSVRVEAPLSVLSRITEIRTEPVDSRDIRQQTRLTVRLIPPPRGKIVDGESVTLKLR